MKYDLWMFLAFVFSIISWKHGETQILYFFEDVSLSVTDFLFTLWVMMGFQEVFRQTSISGIMHHAKWGIECLFLGKYWCKEKGWWIKCSNDCARCSIQTKRSMTLWEARVFCIGLGICYLIGFLVGAYVILEPEIVWTVI